MHLQAQAESEALARQLADRHEARDRAIVSLNRLEEVRACALGLPGFRKRQVCCILQDGPARLH